MIQNLGTYAHPPRGVKGRRPKHVSPGTKVVSPMGANQKPNYSAVGQSTQYKVGANVRGPKTVNEVDMVSAVPGSNSRPAATIPPNGGFKTVQKQPGSTTMGKGLVASRAAKPMKPVKSGKEKRSSKLPFFGA